MENVTAVPAAPIEKRGRGRPMGSKNKKKRGPNVQRKLPPLTSDELFTIQEALHFVPLGESTVNARIKEGRFPRPRLDGKKRILTGRQIIDYRACIAAGKQWREPGLE